MTSPSLFSDFCRFAQFQVDSWDIDPMYPLLRELYALDGLAEEVALWRTLLYTTFYHVGTAAALWERYPEPGTLGAPPAVPLATGVERRGFRGVDGNRAAFANIQQTLEQARSVGGLSAWVRGAAEHGGSFGWDAVRAQFQSIRGNGPWASYKWADLLKNTHRFSIDASDLGVGGGSDTAGPIPGMVKLTGRPWRQCATDRGLHAELLAAARAGGVALSGLDQLETVLCDFNSLVKGGYYAGHDLDLQMTQLEGAPAALWTARAAAIPASARGEVSGWSGVNKTRKTVYRDTGAVLAPQEAR